VTGLPLGHTARLLALRPPLAYGGHAFVLLGEATLYCVGCFSAVPRWAVAEGFESTLLARWCPALFLALPAVVEVVP
jgi:hypothetical protein